MTNIINVEKLPKPFQKHVEKIRSHELSISRCERELRVRSTISTVQEVFQEHLKLVSNKAPLGDRLIVAAKLTEIKFNNFVIPIKGDEPADDIEKLKAKITQDLEGIEQSKKDIQDEIKKLMR